MKRTALKKKPRPKMSAAEREAKDAMKEEVARFCSGECWLKQVMPNHICSGPLDFHHTIKEQTLKAHTSTLPDDERWWIVHAPELVILLCRQGNGPSHERVTKAFMRLPWEYLPPRAIQKAEELRLTHKLERECPPLSEVMFGKEAA